MCASWRSASATSSRRRSPASAAAPSFCATISRRCRPRSAPGSCRTSWPTPRGSNGWCAASSSWRGPTRSCRAAARPVTSCRRRSRSRLARDVSFRSNARRRRCPPQSTANRSISRSPTWSRMPSSMAGRRHRCASRHAPSRAASSSTCPTTDVAYRRRMPGGCSTASSRRRARPAAPVLGLAIVRQRIAAFGGDISLLPGGRGAAFRIRLKAA